MSEKLRMAVLFGNRGFFPGEVAAKAREEMSQAIEMAGFTPVLMDEKLTRYGAIETRAEGKIFADFLAKEKVDGVVICLPNFGDETGAALACRDAGVPILIQAYPDEVGKMDFANRRDAFCGKMSIMRVFGQYKIPFTIDTPHVVHPLNPRFIQQLQEFGGVCRVVNGMRRCTVGAIGARTSAFKTVRYDEVALENLGISVETVDLSEVLGKIALLKDDDASVVAAVEAIKGFTDTSDAPSEALVKMGKLRVVLDEYIELLELDMIAIRCWHELEVYYGCAPCTLAGMLGDMGIPVACEVDVANVVMMYALKLASDTPATLLDWNNNAGDDDEKCILFHCGPVPSQMLTHKGKMVEHKMFAKSYGPGCGWGPVESRLKPGAFTFASSKTENGKLYTYIGEGEITPEEIEKEFFGTCGIAKIENLQEKLVTMGRHGFCHHVATTYGSVANVLREAFTTYLGYEIVELP
ncbi:MAG: hypothetical protein GX842_03845 [Spirochaetales bacterium]|nr:hypothetical protein [Spirochaetales bacterium]